MTDENTNDDENTIPPIQMDEEGNLLDGNHRMWAVRKETS